MDAPRNALPAQNPNVQPAPNPNVEPKQLERYGLDRSRSPQNILRCGICFKSLIGNRPMETVCGHIYCKTCLTEALTQKAESLSCL